MSEMDRLIRQAAGRTAPPETSQEASQETSQAAIARADRLAKLYAQDAQISERQAREEVYQQFGIRHPLFHLPPGNAGAGQAQPLPEAPLSFNDVIRLTVARRRLLSH